MKANVTLRQMRCFLQVAAVGSFTRAAEKMHILQPALSQQIRDLELELGVRLFERTTRRVELTEAGVEFQSAAAKIMEDLELALHNARGRAELKRGRITIAAPPLLAAALAPAAISEFRRDHPGLDVKLFDLTTDQVVELVRTGRADCGLGTFRGDEEGVTSSVLARDSLLVFCPSNHQLATRRAVGWRELGGLPIIALTRNSGIRLLVEVGCEAAQIPFNPTYEVSHVTTALAMIDAQLGVSVLPTYAWATARALRISAAVLTPKVTRNIALITRTGRSINPVVSAFADCLARHLSASIDSEGRPKVPTPPSRVARRRQNESDRVRATDAAARR